MDCDEQCREAFEKKIQGTPLLYKNGVGQYDLENRLQKEFICKYECMKQLKMSDKTLAKALDKEGNLRRETEMFISFLLQTLTIIHIQF